MQKTCINRLFRKTERLFFVDFLVLKYFMQFNQNFLRNNTKRHLYLNIISIGLSLKHKASLTDLFELHSIHHRGERSLEIMS